MWHLIRKILFHFEFDFKSWTFFIGSYQMTLLFLNACSAPIYIVYKFEKMINNMG